MPITIHTPWGDRKEHKEMEGFAKLHGLQFSEGDAFGLGMLPFSVLQGGDSNGCKFVVYGTWNEINAWAFVAWQMDRDNDGSDSYQYFTCGAAPVPADCPRLEIHSSSALVRAFKRAGLRTQPVPFESDAFNRAFKVTASDLKFAHDLVSEQTIEWLLANGRGWHFCISGRYALVYRNRERHDAEQTGQVLDLVVGFYRQIPDVIASLYPLNAPQMTPQLAAEMARAEAAGFHPQVPGSTPAPIPTTNPNEPAGGATGTMTITGIRELGVEMNGGRLVQMDMDVTPHGSRPYHLAQPVLVMPDHADRVKPGARLAVRIDPQNPAQLTVDWAAGAS
jgi:hypothetical protein